MSREVHESEIAWLAGLWDGDGWIGLHRQYRSSHSKHRRYTPGASLLTTSDRILDAVTDILNLMDVGHNVKETSPKKASDGSPRKRKWNIAIAGHTQNEKFLRQMKPHLAEKGKCASLILDFIQWRKAYPARTGGHVGSLIADRGQVLFDELRRDRERVTPQRLHAVPRDDG